ncbi:MAG: glutamate--cysteine ligase [Proteobacteria bacterium]|jgi:glutamate--cysteine ligase|nr:glutamate--cysteine ligase [Pseudomonadota bacterium]
MSVEHLHAVPHLTTALSGPLYDIESHLLTCQAKIETWLRSEWLKTPAPFYASVDLRNAGFKLAPVDTNLFPAGFNNLNPAFIPLCIQAVQSAIEHSCPAAAKVLIIPESHTRNQFYLESVLTLQDIFHKAGFEVRIGSLSEDLEENQQISLPSGHQLVLEPVQRQADRISVNGFDPCVVILNNDLSSGRPEILEGLAQEILPPLGMGWGNRLKSAHFAEYRKVANEFAAMAELDPWFIDPLFRNCGEINFMKREGENCLRKNVDRLLTDIQKKYNEHGIDKPPFVIVKADAGTYGMGIMTVHSADEVVELNRKQRTRMSASKGGQSVNKVIMQEGVYTFETWGKDLAVAEPVVYMIDHFVVGGFYRVHTSRSANENLNAPGMYFEPLAFAETCNSPDSSKAPDADPNRFYAYGVIARLALLAAAREYASTR